MPNAPGLWIASGCNGSGFSSSPAIGEALASWITGNGRPGGAGSGPVPALTDEVLIDQGSWQYAHY